MHVPPDKLGVVASSRVWPMRLWAVELFQTFTPVMPFNEAISHHHRCCSRLEDMNRPKMSPSTSQASVEDVEDIKCRANTAFRSGDMQEALKLYTAAIELCSHMKEQPTQLHVLHSNRSAAWFKLKQFEKSLQDAQAAIKAQPKFVKALFRGAQAILRLPAHHQQADLRLANTWLQTARELEPENKEVKDLIHEALARSAQEATSGRAPHQPPTQRNTLDMRLIPAALRQGAVYLPALDGVSENLLIMLHGLGDTPAPYVKLGQKLALPQTACLILPGPLPVPETEGGRAWFTAFDDEWELIQPNPGEQRRINSLASTLQLLTQLLDNLEAAGLWPRRAVSLFGFSQGGTTALHLHCQHTGAQQRLAGTVSIGGGLLEEQLLLLKSKQPLEAPQSCGPVLITLGDRDDVTPRAVIEESVGYIRKHLGGTTANVVSVPGKGHAMMGSHPMEARAVMEFWSKTLRAAAPVEGAVEVQS